MPLLRTLTTKIKTKISSPAASPTASPSPSPTSPHVSSFEKMSGRKDHDQQHHCRHDGAVQQQQRPEAYVRADSFISSPPSTPKETTDRREKRVSRFREELDFGEE